MKIADNIREIRRQFKLTQEELADIAGVSGASVSGWERGVNVPRMGAIERISIALGIPKSVIVEGGDYAVYASQTFIEIEHHIKHLNEDQLKQVLSYIKFLKSEG